MSVGIMRVDVEVVEICIADVILGIIVIAAVDDGKFFRVVEHPKSDNMMHNNKVDFFHIKDSIFMVSSFAGNLTLSCS